MNHEKEMKALELQNQQQASTPEANQSNTRRGSAPNFHSSMKVGMI